MEPSRRARIGVTFGSGQVLPAELVTFDDGWVVLFSRKPHLFGVQWRGEGGAVRVDMMVGVPVGTVLTYDSAALFVLVGSGEEPGMVTTWRGVELPVDELNGREVVRGLIRVGEGDATPDRLVETVGRLGGVRPLIRTLCYGSLSTVPFSSGRVGPPSSRWEVTSMDVGGEAETLSPVIGSVVMRMPGRWKFDRRATSFRDGVVHKVGSGFATPPPHCSSWRGGADLTVGFHSDGSVRTVCTLLRDGTVVTVVGSSHAACETTVTRGGLSTVTVRGAVDRGETINVTDANQKTVHTSSFHVKAGLTELSC